MKIGLIFPNPKNKTPELQTQGFHEVPCSCGKLYIRQTAKAIETRRNKQLIYVDYKRTDKSAVAEHVAFNQHSIKFQE